MKILVVTQYFWPESFRINDLVQGLQERGHNIHVLTGKPNYPGGRFYTGYGLFSSRKDNYHGINISRVPLLPRGQGGRLMLFLNFFSFVVSAGLLGPLFCRGRYDLIFVYQPSPVTVGLPAVLLKKIKKVPLVFWVQDLWPETLTATGSIRSRWVLKFVEKIVRLIYRNCDNILIQSEAFSAPVQELGANAMRIKYFPNTAEKLYRPITLESDAPEKNKVPDGFRVMFAGNIGASQDFDIILSAAEKLIEYSDIHWVILGDGRMRPWVEEQVRNRGLKLSFHLLGKQPIESMPRYFALAEVLLVTLRREPIFSYTIPSKIQSYLACGKPIIACLEGVGASIVRNAEAGFVVPPENPDALAGAVLDAYKMSEADRREMGYRGRTYFEKNFERSLLLNRLDGWIKQLTEKKQCAS